MLATYVITLRCVDIEILCLLSMHTYFPLCRPMVASPLRAIVTSHSFLAATALSGAAFLLRMPLPLVVFGWPAS